MDPMFVVIGLLIGIAIIFILFWPGCRGEQGPGKRRKTWQDTSVSTEALENEKRKLKPFCSAEEFYWFESFLRNYKGGYVKRSGSKIVYQGFLNKEKGDLKGIFFNIVFPNPNISVESKEAFRNYLVNVGVSGLEQRPDYESRDTKLKNTKKDEEEFKRKEVGNIGEKLVRDVLEDLNIQNEYFNIKNYSVINGPCYRYGDVTKEFDHIVIGKNGLFVIETKAFGMTDGKEAKASLFIDSGDKWIIRKNKTNRELESPTVQIIAEKELIEAILQTMPSIKPQAILLCCNRELYIKNNIELPYTVLRIDELLTYIEKYPGELSEEDQKAVLKLLDTFRIN